MKCRIIRLILSLACFAVLAAGQQPKPPAPQPTPPPTKPPQPPVTQPGPPDQQITNSLRDVSLTGRLVMVDGTPPADMLPVGLRCVTPSQGTVGFNALSDLRGEFRFRLKVPYGPTADMGTRALGWACSVVMTIPGFQSINRSLAGVDIRMGADAGTFVLRPLTKADGTLISLNSLKAPDAARKELLKAREESAKEKWDSAAKHLEKATGIFPEYATASYELGRIQARLPGFSSNWRR